MNKGKSLSGERRAKTALVGVLSVISVIYVLPMLIVLMAFVVGFIIIAVMSPIIGSYSAIESSGNV